MLLSRISVAICLAVIVTFVSGNQTIVHVSEVLGEVSINPFCCVYGNCSCNSLDYAVANLTGNVLINITTDVTLSSLVKLSNVENVSIVGHNNPTVNCTNVGGIHFTFCQNCIIQGIIWHGCGRENHYTLAGKIYYGLPKPGLKLNYSSNITIQNCSFQHSIGQAIVLSEAKGDVNINHCQFVYNRFYRGQGAIIHYLSNNVKNQPQISFKINNCNFNYNEFSLARCLVYIENKNSEHENNISFRHVSFCHNKGTSIYVVNQMLNFHGNLLFLNNTAAYGAGISISDNSAVIFSKNYLLHIAKYSKLLI